jgi:hypothetical protein
VARSVVLLHLGILKKCACGFVSSHKQSTMVALDIEAGAAAAKPVSSSSSSRRRRAGLVAIAITGVCACAGYRGRAGVAAAAAAAVQSDFAAAAVAPAVHSRRLQTVEVRAPLKIGVAQDSNDFALRQEQIGATFDCVLVERNIEHIYENFDAAIRVSRTF